VAPLAVQQRYSGHQLLPHGFAAGDDELRLGRAGGELERDVFGEQRQDDVDAVLVVGDAEAGERFLDQQAVEHAIGEWRYSAERLQVDETLLGRPELGRERGRGAHRLLPSTVS
jgi:hypothetical protein